MRSADFKAHYSGGQRYCHRVRAFRIHPACGPALRYLLRRERQARQRPGSRHLFPLTGSNRQPTTIIMRAETAGPRPAHATPRSRASNPEKRRSVRLFRTAIARALPCPTSTTSRFPRVTPV